MLVDRLFGLGWAGLHLPRVATLFDLCEADAAIALLAVAVLPTGSIETTEAIVVMHVVDQKRKIIIIII